MSFDPYQRTVEQEMSTDVISIHSSASLLSALDLMNEKAVTALPVVDDDERCIGVISTTDIANAVRETASKLREMDQADDQTLLKLVREMAGNGLVHTNVRKAMRFKLKCVRKNTPITRAGRKMLFAKFHHLPVVDDDRRIIGIVSTLDLLAAFIKAAPGGTPEESIDETTDEVCPS